MSDIQQIIETAFERRAEITPANADAQVRNAVNEVLGMLDSGKARVAEKQNGDWVVNQWLKKAVLLSFRLNDNRPMSGGETQYFDKVEPKFANFTEADFNTAGVRVVPPAAARRRRCRTRPDDSRTSALGAWRARAHMPAAQATPAGWHRTR